MIVNEHDAEVRGAEQTRLRILAATRELFASRGTRGTTTREVAIRASVNEATLFRHFGTKQQLVDAMLEFYSRWEAPWAELARAAPSQTLEAQLLTLGSAAIDSMLRRQDLIRMTMAEELMNPEGNKCAWRGPSESRRMLVDFFERETLSGELSGDPEFLACTFMSLFFAYVMGRKIWGPYDRPTEDVLPAIVKLFLNGARA